MAQMLRESSKKDEYMKNAESKIDKILDTIRTGGTLSKEEEELVNNELKNMSAQKYKDYKDLRLNPEDVMEQLKANYMRRERIFFDMQKQLEVDANNQLADFDTVKIMTYMQEKENDEKIIEMVEECAENEDEKNLKEDTENDEIVDKETDKQELNVNVGDKPVDEMELEDGNLQKRAMKMIENIENEMNDVKEASENARKKENIFAKTLEDDYKRIQKVLNNDEVSIENKVEAYDRFVKEAGVNARGREIQRIKKQFDAETLMMARIMFQGHNRIDNVINGNMNHNQIGTEFIKSFLI
ncbi:MAG: hypothetical protein IKJ01_05950, partial [Lachnospiraceae bacterium]|nr:hypothetical protein [Lachnospiraceae bacterium]